MTTDTGDEEILRKALKPQCLESTVVELAKNHFGLTVDEASVKELDSYDDKNYYLRGTMAGQEEVKEYTLKVHNGVESENHACIDAQDAFMNHLRGAGINCPAPIQTLDGSTMAFARLPRKENIRQEQDPLQVHAVRLLIWVSGKPMSTISPTLDQLTEAGKYLGQLHSVIQGFDHPGAHREHSWDIVQTSGLRNFLGVISNPARRELVQSVITEFEAAAQSYGQLPKGIIMGDFNDANIILDAEGQAVHGVIDFGDMIHSWLVNDLAIAMAYATLTTPGKEQSPVAAAAALYAGYLQVHSLSPVERSVLRVLVACRLACSCTMGALSISKDPTNEYLSFHAEPAWTSLEKYWGQSSQEVEAQFDAATASIGKL